MTWPYCARPARRPSRSRNGSPGGWSPGASRFNEAKTRIVHLSQGFDFLGFSIRRYPNGKLLTKPSKEAMRRIRERLSAEATALRGANADAVIGRLNPIITGSPGRADAAGLTTSGTLSASTHSMLWTTSFGTG